MTALFTFSPAINDHMPDLFCNPPFSCAAQVLHYRLEVIFRVPKLR